MSVLTSRFKIPIIQEGSTSWADEMAYTLSLLDVMYTVIARKDYVISGLAVTSSPSSLNISYSAGSVSINGNVVTLPSGNAAVEASIYNWVYVQGGQVKVSTLPPTGVAYVPLAALGTDATGVVGNADLRTSPPTVKGISIAPTQVNPTDNVNMNAGKRFLHADTTTGSNIIMLTNDNTQTIVDLPNQVSAIDWGGYSVNTIVESATKFAILNCYITTVDVTADGWAVLELKTNDSDDDYVYNIVDYGHPNAAVLNSIPIGKTTQIILPLDGDKKFRARTLVSNLGVGSYYTRVKIVGYIV